MELSYLLQFVQNDELVLLQTVPSLQQVNSVDNEDVLITLEGNECIVIFKKLKIRLKFHWFDLNHSSQGVHKLQHTAP